MTHDCACTRPIHDTAVICPHCGHEIDAALSAITEHHGLAWDLDIARTRQSRMGSRDGSRPTEAAVPFDDRAGKAADTLRRRLRVIAVDVVAVETRAVPPGDQTLVGLAVWLRPRVGWIRYHDHGARHHDDIVGAVRAARRVCDRPAEKLYAGPCDCGEDLYGRMEARYVECPNLECGAVWNVEDRRLWLLESARDVLATATEISRALTRYAQPVTPSALRGYVHRGQLISRGERVEGRRMVMLYRLGDVLDILARQAERVSA